MSDKTTTDETSTDDMLSPVLHLVHVVRGWANVHPFRSAAIATGLLLAVPATIMVWVYLTSLAVKGRDFSLDEALAAWDRRDLAEAKDAIRRLQNAGGFAQLGLGGPLFVLGAVKSTQADEQWSAGRRQADHLVASRYLQEADAHGFPPGREGEGYYLLGKSLVESHQLHDGVAALDKALALDPPDPLAIYRLLARAHAEAPVPSFEKALEHNQRVLEADGLAVDDQADAQLLQAQILIGLGRFADAHSAIAAVPAAAKRQRWIDLLTAQALLAQVAAAVDQQKSDQHDLASQIARAVELLQRARQGDQQGTEVTRRAMYLQGRAYQLRGDTQAALEQYALARKSFVGTPEALAAALAEAELLQDQQEFDAALSVLRRVLQGFTDPSSYRNPLLTLPQLRRRVVIAFDRFVTVERFSEALAMLDHYVPLFDQVATAEIRAHTLQQWGEVLLERAPGPSWRLDPDHREARRHLREAGVAYEELARLRFATPQYTDDLWNAAENYLHGQSFSSVVRVLNDYLHNEPELRNPQALLRLGQSQLALGNVERSIANFEECIDFHPHDAASYRARIDCAGAYLLQNDAGRAEQLLLSNLDGANLSPRSAEWRDSLFELGQLLHDQGRYEEAIRRLEEAVARYDDAPQALMTRYLIADSYRQAARGPLERLDSARTASEREKSQQLANRYLSEALSYYNQVQRTINRLGMEKQDELQRTMLRNCYMMQGSVYFDLARYDEAIKSYSNVSALYQHEPFVLETFVQISHCYRRQNRPAQARGAVQQAQILLEGLPADADFLVTTNFSRRQWESLLAEMSKW